MLGNLVKEANIYLPDLRGWKSMEKESMKYSFVCELTKGKSINLAYF